MKRPASVVAAAILWRTFRVVVWPWEAVERHVLRRIGPSYRLRRAHARMWAICLALGGEA